ncbi:MAG: CRISPR-associated helicase/endonuclease Cas3 [Sulfobacillus thermosulfidooxidans]|uniref:CRISPR-associated helicase/endonuclease Cas3 n=1 Tax=Sulfobacillus thermosulfidooxidans TaxID=28034 RepID=A0A2T2WQ32_SULTH|nr:MAG: CRISPR-associated helicase/endonuclease Cas3 [Sulfobacillus thermosulfidooxidans]
MNYETFFKSAVGFTPYDYQVALAASSSLTGILHVPTGMGKTDAVITAWIWHRRFASPEIAATTPRRLVYCLPFRALVTQTAQRVEKILQQIGMDKDIRLSVLMGGDIDPDWDEYPEWEQIIVGTQDQLLSRALNRGYTMSRYRWPIAFGLLNSDVLWVYDEVQGMGPALSTAAQLHAFRDLWGVYGPHQSLWMSATLDVRGLRTVDFQPFVPKLQEWRLSGTDVKSPVVTARKPISQLPISVTHDFSFVQELATHIVREHRPASLTLVVLNQVFRAQRVKQALDRLGVQAEVILVHSRYRTSDRQRIEAALFSPIPPEGRIIVSTQVIEAGMDLSARLLYTELASWGALVQRFGRCNRRGEYSDAAVYWWDLNDDPAITLPYTEDEMNTARRIMREMTDASIALLPQEVEGTVSNHSVIRQADLLALFDTATDLSGMDVDISRFIRDKHTLDVSVFWRFLEDGVDQQPDADRKELCPVSLNGLKRYLDVSPNRQAYGYDAIDGCWQPVAIHTLHPGMIVMLDANLGGYLPDMGFLPESDIAVPLVEHDTGVPEADTADPLSRISRFVSLRDHLVDTKAEAEKLAEHFPGDWPRQSVILAAYLHDWGKASPEFQEILTAGCLPPEAGLWAKSPCGRRWSSRRPHYRHEWASALAILETGGDDLVAYLVAAHHGKVRLVVRSVAGEKEPEDDRRFARGVWQGDRIPSIELPDGTLPGVECSLDVLELGRGQRGPSWIERTQNLLKQHGPFRLAWYEALVRIADWRATRREAQSCEH